MTEPQPGEQDYEAEFESQREGIRQLEMKLEDAGLPTAEREGLQAYRDRLQLRLTEALARHEAGQNGG